MIKIAVAFYDNAAPASPMSAVFGRERKTLGRSDDNFLVLPDPKHEVSRAQAAVWSDGERHMLINLSHATPIRVNGQEIDMDREVEIAVGDQIQVGPYLLRAEADDGAAPAAMPAAGAGADAGTADAMLDVDTIAAHDAQGEAHEPVQPATATQAPASAAIEAGEADTSATEPTDVRALKEAFLRGAGIPVSAISSGLTPELMEMVGKLLASSLQGSIDLLALRSLVKREVKADVTMVVLRNNNPLKFFPDSKTVLTQMLRKKMPGFMEPLEAVDDANCDLRGHQLGVVAGMRAGMEVMLQRLNPDNFGEGLEKPTLADSLLPSRRPALMWQRFAKQYEAIRHEGKDDFQTLFGTPFLDAYEKEVERFNDELRAG